MKKRTLFISALLTIGIIAGSIIAPRTNKIVANDVLPEKDRPNCESLTKSYPTIRDILTIERNKNAENKDVYTTWGTVTAVYQQSGFHNAYIQNTKEGGKSAALCLYKMAPDSQTCPVSVGDFLIAKGKTTYYNGMYEILMNEAGNSFEVRNDLHAYDVVPMNLPIERLTATKGSNEWEENIKTGPARVILNDATIKSVSSNTFAKVTIPGSSKEIKIYFGGISSRSNDIGAAFNSYKSSGGKVNIIGYLNAFDKSGQEETQILVRYADDIYQSGNYVPASSIRINTFSDIDLNVGESMQLDATVLPVSATDRTYSWLVDDRSVLSIDSTGLITGISEGITKVTAISNSDNSIEDYIFVCVNEAGFVPIENLYFDHIDGSYNINDFQCIPVNVGDTGTLNFSVIPSNASRDVEFYSDDITCVTIDNNGNWKAINPGICYIEVTSIDNMYIGDVIAINVIDPDVPTLESISVSPSSVYMGLEETTTVTVTTNPSGFDCSLLNAFINADTYYSPVDVVDINKNGVISLQSYDEEGSCELNVQYFDPSKGLIAVTVPVTVGKEIELEKSDTIYFTRSVGTFSTNFGSLNLGSDSIRYNYYRASSNSAYWTLYPSCNLTSSLKYSLPGSFSNETSKYAITSMDITYTGAGTVRYGVNKNCTNSTTLSSSSSQKTVTVNTVDAFFFYVEADKGELLKLSEIKFNYDLTKKYNNSNVVGQRVNTRIPATVYSGTLVDGVSYVDVPIDVTINGDYYTVNKTKRYTYYSYSYVYAHRDELDLNQIAMTDPVDVANYYIAFHCAPANYTNKGDVDEIKSTMGTSGNVQSLFGSKARYVSQYSRTDGYAIGLPCGSHPTYLEFDFDGNGDYSYSKRDVCRVVLWATGWEGTGYGNEAIATYTDDHYVTFREFNNCGGWNEPFDSVQNGKYTQLRTNYYYGSTKTLTKR